MKSFDQLKEEAAREKGYSSWEDCLNHLPKPNVDQFLSTLAEVYRVGSLMEAHADRDDNLEKTVSALQGLVNLKKHKDQKGKDDFYTYMQPIVWERAFEVLSKI